MPTYDYHCKACDSRLEIFQSITDKPIKKCPNCKKNALERLIGSGAGIIFKGSGFYETDYRSNSYRAQAGKESSAASVSSAKNGDSKMKSDDAPKNGSAGSSKASGPKDSGTPKNSGTQKDSGSPGKKDPGKGSHMKAAS